MNPRSRAIVLSFSFSLHLLTAGYVLAQQTNAALRPNIILIMTDDQGWNETGYNNHPELKTPNLDAMARNGLRIDRFYAGSPVCSPTRATVLTGRSNDRAGVFSHGYPLNPNEKTLSQALQKVGYRTGHFGKWHLNGVRGPGIPIHKNDPFGPGSFGFDTWLSSSNFFDYNPLLSENGEFKKFKGSPSDLIVRVALSFIQDSAQQAKPFLAVIWDAAPHDPHYATPEDRDSYSHLSKATQHHHGEITAFDRSLGTLRQQLREMDVHENTLLWYCSDNGGLNIDYLGRAKRLRGQKGSLWEGGIRVPAIIEWPASIKPAATAQPASTLDIFPTISDILQLNTEEHNLPQDGVSLKALFEGAPWEREKPIPFRINNRGALINQNYKLVTHDIKSELFALYDLSKDPNEEQDLSQTQPDILNEMKQRYMTWNLSVESSQEGADYNKPITHKPSSHSWNDSPLYKPYIKPWILRPEYRTYILKHHLNKAISSRTLQGCAAATLFISLLILLKKRTRR